MRFELRRPNGEIHAQAVRLRRRVGDVVIHQDGNPKGARGPVGRRQRLLEKRIGGRRRRPGRGWNPGGKGRCSRRREGRLRGGDALRGRGPGGGWRGLKGPSPGGQGQGLLDA
jgi:hypothetical protein